MSEVGNTVEQGLEAAQTARLGTVLPGGWTLKSVVGIGGMAAIFEAVHESGRLGAVKLMHAHLVQIPALRARFDIEVEVLERIEHPAAVGLFAKNFTLGREPYFVMELLSGHTLAKSVRSSNRVLSFPEALRIADHLLDVLGCCHDAGVIHRDIKPSNVFLDLSHNVRLLDFGVALCNWREPPPSEGVLGTPAYMAPEQAMGTVELDNRADLFSVGALLFQLLSGKRVNEGRTTEEGLVIAATTPARSLATERPEVPMEVIQFVDKALAFDRRERFTSAMEMRFVIDELVEREEELRLEAENRTARINMAAFAQVNAGEVPPEDDPVFAGILRFFEAMRRVFRTVRTYGWGHNEAARVHGLFAEAYEKLVRDTGEEVGWTVTPSAFEHEGKIVWEPVAPFDDIPYNLFVSGFRAIRVLPGVSESEWVELLRLMQVDTLTESNVEDDLATLFVEKNLEHIVATLINPVESLVLLQGVDSIQASFQLLEDELRNTMRDLEGTSLAGEAEAVGIAVGNEDDLDEHLAIQARALALNPKDLHDLRASMRLSKTEWKERLAIVLSEAVREVQTHGDQELVTEPFSELCKRWISVGRFFRLLELYEALTHYVAADTRRVLATRSFDVPLLELLLDGLLESEEPTPEEAAVGLSTLLLDLGPSIFEVVVLRYTVCTKPLVRPALDRYVRQCASGNGNLIAQVLETAPTESATELLHLARHCGDGDASIILSAASRHGDRKIWSAALAERLRRGDSSSAAELRRLLFDDDEGNRIHALSLIRDTAFLPMSEALSQRALDPDFSTISMKEARLTLRTLGTIDPERAEGTALELLAKKGLKARLQKDHARTAAIELLAQVGHSHRAIDTLNRVGKERWARKGNIARLIDATKQAVEARGKGSP